ncbi:MAG: tRNA (adenosine(37)-N6)-threonylcarbamoyltransferase complex dimerization subunit type 1 TsaB [Chlamydiales bacterium]
MKKLIIDTSHERSFVAFAEGVNILLNLALPFGFQSSSFLFPAIQSGFQKLNLTPSDLEEVAVVVGPGSFTGIRVGVAAAKGIAFPKQLPLTGLCSLYGFTNQKDEVAFIDAKIGGAFILIPGEAPRLVSQNDFPHVLKGNRVIVGPNLQRFSFPNQIERNPDPISLITHPVFVKKKDLQMLYLRETV